MPAVVTTIIGPLVVNAPLAVALVVGLVLTLRHRRHDPRAAQLVIIGLILAFASLLLSGGLQVLSGIFGAVRVEVSRGTIETVYAAVNVIASLLTAAAWILAAVALIRTRRPSQPAPAYGQPPAV